MDIRKEFIIDSFSGEKVQEKYIKSVFEIGLWESEKIIFQQYFKKSTNILDIGCGAGRTTFGLSQLGYNNIVGLDVTPKMIESAMIIQNNIGTDIEFVVGDACNLTYTEEQFEGCIFSFNGLMQIPKKENRLKAMKEINRVLKKDGYFIFTTHDRANEEWLWFWEEEKERWERGEIDIRIFEYGDRILPEGDRDIFLHFPSRSEILELIEESNFKVIDDRWIFDIADEPKIVRDDVSGCRFWIVQK